MRFDDFRHAFDADALYVRHGRFPLAYATLQPGLRYAHDERGYIAYARSSKLDHRSVLVLGDPVCAAVDAAGLLGDFLARYPGSLFVAAGEGTAATLAAAHALRRVRLGTEIGIEPAALARPAGHERVEELSPEEARALRASSEAWLHAGGAVPERRFVARPLGAPDRHQRWFLSRSADRTPECLAVFDACRDGGAVSGYRSAACRVAPQAPPFAHRLVLERVASALAEERCPLLWLGIAPPSAAESRTDDHLFLGLLRTLVGVLAAAAGDQPACAAEDVPDGTTRAPVYLVGRNGWGIEYVSALRDVANLAA